MLSCQTEIRLAMSAKYKVVFKEKFSEKYLDEFIDGFYTHFSNPNNAETIYEFDFSRVKFVANQELLVLTSILKMLVDNNIRFKFFFLEQGVSPQIDYRKASQIIQIWDIWKIIQVVPDGKFDKYFDINGNFISYLKNKYKIASGEQAIYDRYGVTPFITLDKIENYDDRMVAEMLHSVYQLSEATAEILKKYNSELPFKNQTISLIITKELYENFLDHFTTSFLGSNSNQAFLSLSLVTKFNQTNHAANEIQTFHAANFQEEKMEAFRSFYTYEDERQFKNQSILELSFLDFGIGIPNTLRNSFLAEHKDIDSPSDNDVLRYAFYYNSSKSPINKRYLLRDSIPRGLFDLLTVVKRFNGLVVIRSNFGKILYDFSRNQSMEEAFKTFGDERLFFPGSLISIYLPERLSDENIDCSVIKPIVFDNTSYSQAQKQYVNLFKIQNELKQHTRTKEDVYERLFENLYNEFTKENKRPTLIYLDFDQYELDERVSKKIIYFLVSDYNIHSSNSVVVINPPPKTFLDLIQNEIRELSTVVKQFNIHPTPFIYYNEIQNDITIYWLGIFHDGDAEKLNELLFDISDLRKSDFNEPDSVVGNVNYYDAHGNLKSQIDREQIISVIKNSIISSRLQEFEEIVKGYIKKETSSIFLCNGNYYQHEFIQIYDALNDESICDYLSSCLFQKIEHAIGNISDYKFLCISTTSQKIANYLVNKGLISNSNLIICESYHTFYLEENFVTQIDAADNIVLVCDIISTGHLTRKLEEKLVLLKAHLSFIAVLVNAIDYDFDAEHNNYDDFKNKIIAPFQYSIKKFRRKQIEDKLLARTLEVIRINPYTNTPVTLGIDHSYHDTVLLTNNEFINLIEEKHVKAGYYKFNSLIHPYFFDMDAILKDDTTCSKVLAAVFGKIDLRVLVGIDVVFYPKNSGIRNINHDILRNNVLKNHKLLIVELERFSTNEGWRFPHPAENLGQKAKSKKVLILDDGSCSGESIIQMIGEVAFLEVQEIIVLSIIGRVNDHKRDFFSKIKSINTSSRKSIPVSILFGSHWHVPTYYIEESPIVKEKNWLDEVIQLSNIPLKLKEIAQSVQSELFLKNIDQPNNKYLITHRDKSPVVKDLVLTKEEIGKITTYRFYKEHFYFFDEIIRTYANQEFSQDRYRKIELICAVFLHEPELYFKVKTILPDLSDKIEEFAETMIIGNPNKEGRPKLKLSTLYYEWSLKNVLHLFFIVFRDEKLMRKLDTDNILMIIKDFCITNSDVNYLLYRLLKYFPINRKDVSSKVYGGELFKRLDVVLRQLKDSDSADEDFKYKSLRQFVSFLLTIPYEKESFADLIFRLQSNFKLLTDKQFHKDKKTLNQHISISISQLTILSALEPSDSRFIKVKNTIKKSWSEISYFIQDLLRFSIQYKDYLLPYANMELYNLLEDDSKLSLRKMYSFLSPKIENLGILTSEEDIQLAKQLLESIMLNFAEGSDFERLFTQPSTTDGKRIYSEFLKNIFTKYKLENIVTLPGFQMQIPEGPIDLPELYFEKVIFDELFQNLRHAIIDRDSPAYIGWKVENNHLIFNIQTKQIVASHEGGGNGIVNIERMSQSDLFNFRYVQLLPTDNQFYFNQTFTFNKI